MAEQVLHHLTPVWSDRVLSDPRREPLCSVQREAGRLVAMLALPTTLPDGSPGRPYSLTFPVRVGDPVVEECGVMMAWGLRRLGPGTWAVAPSIDAPGVVHAYVVLCEVPEPAPFEVTEGASPQAVAAKEATP